VIFPWLTEGHIRRAAHTLLQEAFGPASGRPPKIDLEELVCDFLSERQGLAFNDDASLGLHDGDLILGRTYPLRDRIELDRSLKAQGQEGRYRFTLAHELGHWVLHRPLYLADAQSIDLFEAPLQSQELVSLNRAVFPGARYKSVAPEEWQANCFATCLLLNPESLRAEFVRRFGEPPLAHRAPQWRLRTTTLHEHACLIARCQANGLTPLCELFGVSVEAMAIALESRGYAVEWPLMV
jgi:hypothetical protein